MWTHVLQMKDEDKETDTAKKEEQCRVYYVVLGQAWPTTAATQGKAFSFRKNKHFVV